MYFAAGNAQSGTNPGSINSTALARKRTRQMARVVSTTLVTCVGSSMSRDPSLEICRRLLTIWAMRSAVSRIRDCSCHHLGRHRAFFLHHVLSWLASA